MMHMFEKGPIVLAFDSGLSSRRVLPRVAGEWLTRSGEHPNDSLASRFALATRAANLWPTNRRQG